jgi:hypothetical protein
MPRKNQAIVDEAVTYQIPAPTGEVQLETFIPWTLVKRGVKREVITPLDAPEAFREEAAAERQARKASEDSALVRALGLAHYWQTLLDSGKARTPADIARLEAMNVVQVREILRLSLLAPDIIEVIVDARAPRRLTLEFLLRRSIPRDWEEQCRLVRTAAFGIPGPF